MARKSITGALLVVVIFAFSHLLQASPLHKRPPGKFGHPGPRHGPPARGHAGGRHEDCGSCGPGGPGGSCGPNGPGNGCGPGGPGAQRCPPGGQQRCPPGAGCGPEKCPPGAQGGASCAGGPGCAGGAQRCPPGGKQRCPPGEHGSCPPNAKCSPEMCGPGGPGGPGVHGKPGRRHRQHRSVETETITTFETTTITSNNTLDSKNITLSNETAIDTLTPPYYGDNTTAVRVKRNGCGCGCCGCGCCCCKPCCCCCCPCCCCCCPCCCCCCPCCCCCCKPCCCCCCKPCCCCCCPCCCGCGCCGCGGGRRRRAIANLTHKLMNKQAKILRASAEFIDFSNTTSEATTPFTSTTVEAMSISTPKILTHAEIDSFGRTKSYGSLAIGNGENFNLTLSIATKN